MLQGNKGSGEVGFHGFEVSVRARLANFVFATNFVVIVVSGECENVASSTVDGHVEDVYSEGISSIRVCFFEVHIYLDGVWWKGE
jgi:hypothetical protein